MNKTLKLTYRKSTKGTHVYENEAYNFTLYVPKLMLDNPEQVPQSITVTVATNGSLNVSDLIPGTAPSGWASVQA